MNCIVLLIRHKNLYFKKQYRIKHPLGICEGFPKKNRLVIDSKKKDTDSRF